MKFILEDVQVLAEMITKNPNSETIFNRKTQQIFAERKKKS